MIQHCRVVELPPRLREIQQLGHQGRLLVRCIRGTATAGR